jgi:voltage-gated potassium channel
LVTSLLLLFKFGYDIIRRLIHDAYFRALGSALLTILLVGTLFFWLAEGRTFLQALAYSAATMAMNSPYGIGWGPQTTGGILFNIIYLFLSVGLFLLFVLEAGKTMVQSYEEFFKKMAERKALKRAKKQAAAEILS